MGFRSDGSQFRMLLHLHEDEVTRLHAGLS